MEMSRNGAALPDEAVLLIADLALILLRLRRGRIQARFGSWNRVPI